jgi:autotransporter strand-loop-strand O-heptosyltransferase
MELDSCVPDERRIEQARKALGWNPNHKHVLMVGIWNVNKNQSELIDLAHKMIGQKVEFHFVGTLAQNFSNYWKQYVDNKPINCHVYGERSDVDTFYDAADCLYFSSTYDLNPLVIKEAFAHGLVVLSRALDVYSPAITEHHRFTEIDNNPINNQRKLENILGLPYEAYTLDRTNGITVHIHPAEEETKYEVEFSEGDNLVFQTGITGGQFARPNSKYNRNWSVKVNGQELDTSLSDKSVRVVIDSKSIGDTLAWLPQAIRFGKEYNISDLEISTYHNDLFDYPNVKLVPPSTMKKYDAVFKIGFYYDDYKHKAPVDPRTVPLGAVASGILGIPYVETRPVLKNLSPTASVKSVFICSESTAGAKLWNRFMGWQELIDMLVQDGYNVTHIGTKPSGLNGCKDLVGLPLTEVVNALSQSVIFIGLASGMSWLAWACNLPVVLISGFSADFAEFKDGCFRVGPGHDSCNAKCWNNTNFKFDREIGRAHV